MRMNGQDWNDWWTELRVGWWNWLTAVRLLADKNNGDDAGDDDEDDDEELGRATEEGDEKGLLLNETDETL